MVVHPNRDDLDADGAMTQRSMSALSCAPSRARMVVSIYLRRSVATANISPRTRYESVTILVGFITNRDGALT